MANGDIVITRYWPVIVVLGASLLAAGGAQFQVNALADEVDRQKESDRSTELAVARIEVRQENLKDDVDEIKNKIKEQSEAIKRQNDKLDKIIEKLSED